MFDFGVGIRKSEQGEFTAILADLPEGPQGKGATALEAYEELLRGAADALTQFLAAGHRPQPLIDAAGPRISVGTPTVIQSSVPAAGEAGPTIRVSARDKGVSYNYSWRNNTLILEG